MFYLFIGVFVDLDVYVYCFYLRIIHLIYVIFDDLFLLSDLA